jgi:hypothetical protein
MITANLLPLKLKAIRIRLGLSEREISKVLKSNQPLDDQLIKDFESGSELPSSPLLLEYARLGNTCMCVLVDDELVLPPERPGTNFYRMFVSCSSH